MSNVIEGSGMRYEGERYGGVNMKAMIAKSEKIRQNPNLMASATHSVPMGNITTINQH